MTVETLRDFLKWTQAFHQEFAMCMKDCAEKNQDIRAEMLLGYISNHEKELASIVDGFAHSSSERALNTWVYEFFEKPTVLQHNDECGGLFENLDTRQIMDKVITQHNEIIKLYRQLHANAVVTSTKDLLEQLTSLEENHIRQMVQSANWMDDV